MSYLILYEMKTRFLQVLQWFLLACPISGWNSRISKDPLDADQDLENNEDHWNNKFDTDDSCVKVRSSARDIGKRFYAILPYFDKEHSNTAFLYKFRATVSHMSQAEDMLDREAAFYAAALTPVIFMHRYRDTWCLLERFHRALRLYQISHPTEKRASLKRLQNYRSVNQKIRMFLLSLPNPNPAFRPMPQSPIELNLHLDDDERDLSDKKDIRFLKELVRNLG